MTQAKLLPSIFFALCCSTLPAHADGGESGAAQDIANSNADALFCRQVFVEYQSALTAAGLKADSDFALERGLALYTFEENLQQSDPKGYAAARRSADSRFQAIPKGAGRPAAMRTAYERCLAREGADKPPSPAARQAAEQRYCARLLDDVAVELQESADTLDDRAKATLAALRSAADALKTPQVTFRTDLTAKDDRDAANLLQKMDADLDARLGKSDHDAVLEDAVAACFESYSSGRLGVPVKR